jgi:hypothetical protein
MTNQLIENSLLCRQTVRMFIRLLLGGLYKACPNETRSKLLTGERAAAVKRTATGFYTEVSLMNTSAYPVFKEFLALLFKPLYHIAGR